MNHSILNTKSLKILVLSISLLTTLGIDFLVPNNIKKSFIFSPYVEAQTTSKINEAKVFFDRASMKYGDKAIADYTEAIRLNPKYYEAFFRRGLSKSILGDSYGAISDYTEAIRINPKYGDAYFARGLSRSLKDNYGAIADYTEAIRFKPKHTVMESIYESRGNAKSRLGDYYGAIADWDETIRLNPKYSFMVYLNRGIAKAETKDTYGAIFDYTEAIRLYPQFADAYFYRGLAKFSLLDKRGAINDYTRAAELYDQQGETKKLQILLQTIKKSIQ